MMRLYLNDTMPGRFTWRHRADLLSKFSAKEKLVNKNSKAEI
jgi:hypothetical protein